jgi:formylglycine-generating enzyme required for sulfatase activity
VESAQWIEQLAQRNEQFGSPQGYFCYVPQGTYRIGGWEAGKKSAELTLNPFWIARFPITVAQYAPFVAQGYGLHAKRWWTPNGWKWKQADNRQAPYDWGVHHTTAQINQSSV